MKKNYVIISIVLFSLSANAQKNNYYTELQPGLTNSHYVKSFDLIGDSGYVVCSQSSGYTADKDVLLSTTDKDGLQKWTINYDFGAVEDGMDVINTTDGGFLFCGLTGGGFVGPPNEALVVKTNANGSIQWSKKALDPSGTINSYAQAVIDNLNGTYTVLGAADNNILSDNDIFLWNLDANGDTVWTTSFANSGDDSPIRLIRNSNGDLTILSVTASPGVAAPYIMRVDSNGTKLWSKVYDVGKDFAPRGIVECSDGGYIVVGYIRRQIAPSIDADAAVMKLDANGNVTWVITHGKYMPNNSSAEYGIGITQTFDGGYAISGLTNAYSSSSGFQDIYTYKIDSVGNHLWTKLYSESDGANNAAVDIYENADSTLSIAGQHGTNPPSLLGQTHTFILKTSFRGDIGCLEKDTLPDTTIAYTATVTTPSETIASYTATENITAVTTNESLTQVTACINADTSTYNAVDFGICLVINEVHIRPTGFYGQTTREYIELYNSSGTDTVDLTGWYIRTDLANDVLNPIFGDNMIVTWAERYPGTTPFDSIVGWLDTNTIMIPPQGIAVILEPNWNDSVNINELLDIPDSTIILTCDTFLYFGSNSSDGNQPNNGLLQNKQDFVSLYDGDPTLFTSNNIDSVGWYNDTVKVEQGFSLQRDNDCVLRWHYLAALDTSAGYARDTDSSIFLAFSLGLANYQAATITGSSDSLCIGDSAFFSFQDNSCTPYNYLWGFDDPGSGSADTSTSPISYHVFDTSGVFNVSLIISNACMLDTLYKTITVGASLSLDLGNDTTICPLDTLTLDAANPGASYLWSTGDTSQTINVSDTGTYYVTVNTICGSLFDSVTISVNPLPVVNAGDDTTIFVGSSVELSGSGGPSYLWNPSTGLSCTTCQNPIASPAETTTYYLSVTDANGCTATDSITIIVEPLVVEPIINVIFVPNVFSPNGDDVNDVLDVQGSGYESLYIAVYDRWGEKVFESTSVDVDWDGTYKGKKLNSATFAYYLEILFLNGEEYEEKGNIALIR